MKTYQFQILRYRHDFFTQEFVNVGIVIFNREEKILKVEILKKYSRISDFFANADGKYLKEKLKEVENAIQLTQKKILNPELFDNNIQDLEKITENILPKDDGSFYFSEVQIYLDIDITPALEDIFNKYILSHLAESSSYNTDEKVWNDIYQNYFDKYEITPKLMTHTIKTQNDEFKFEHAFKNGIWNIYEPISFNLQDTQNIKNKVYKWVGKIAELSNISEEVSLNFLSDMPKKDDLQQFIKSKLNNDTQKSLLHIKIINGQNIETFIKEEKEKIINH